MNGMPTDFEEDSGPRLIGISKEVQNDENAMCVNDLGTAMSLDVTCHYCNDPITDQSCLLVGAYRFHTQCLICQRCGVPLYSESSCFEKKEQTYCRCCYQTLYPQRKCNGCLETLVKDELVMKIGTFYYHTVCFSCHFCKKSLKKGDKFGMVEKFAFCEEHFLWVKAKSSMDADLNSHKVDGLIRGTDDELDLQRGNTSHDDLSISGDETISPCSSIQDDLGLYHPLTWSLRDFNCTNRPGIDDSDVSLACSMQQNALYSRDQNFSCPGALGELHGSDGSMGHHGNQLKRKPKRVRTSFKHFQLKAMKGLFEVNQNPDSSELLVLSKNIGLSKRVLQVWFQNARAKYRKYVSCKDKKTGPSDHSSIKEES